MEAKKVLAIAHPKSRERQIKNPYRACISRAIFLTHFKMGERRVISSVGLDFLIFE